MKQTWSVLLVVFFLAGCSRPLREATPTTEITLSPTETPTLAASPTPLPSPEFQATPTAEGVKTDTLSLEITSGKVARYYRLHVPAGYQPGVALPLVFNFHGFGSNATEQETLSRMSDKADEAGFLVVYPDGLDAQWNTGPGAAGERDVQFVRDLIAVVSSQYSVDDKRIFATGFSNGGGMANRLGCDMAEVFAAIAPVAGGYNFWEQCQPSRPLPVLAFHGLDDNVIVYEGGRTRSMLPPIMEWAAAWAALNGCELAPLETAPVEGVTLQAWTGCRDQADVLLYALAGHGHSWPGSDVMPRNITSQAVRANDVMWEFFLAHPLP